VEFYWPEVNTPILRANAAQGTVLHIVSDSDTGRFQVDGDVELRNGEMYYVQRNFYIRSGALFFNETEDQFEPRLSVRAEIRDRTDDGPVTIFMIVDNEPLLDFEPRFESTPSLSQVEIHTLLGQNLSGSDEGGINSLIAFGADFFFSQFIGVRSMERWIRNTLGLDMFSFRTLAFSTWVSNLASISGIGAPVDTLGRLGNYFDNTSVFIGKYFGSDMFVQGMLLLRYNELTGNLQTDLSRTNSGLVINQFILEPDIGIELRGPLFDISWNITPLHMENLFVNDMSFTLTRRWTIGSGNRNVRGEAP
jgi:hypothetical protein